MKKPAVFRLPPAVKREPFLLQQPETPPRFHRPVPPAYGWAVGGPRRPLWLGTAKGMASDGRPDVPYQHFKPSRLRTLSSRHPGQVAAGIMRVDEAAGANLRSCVPRALTVGSKLPERAPFGAHVRQQAGQLVDAHGQAGLSTPAIAVATSLVSSRALPQYMYVYRPATSQLQKIRSSNMEASDGAWMREPNSVGRDTALPLPQQHMTRFNTLGDARPQPHRPAPRPPPQPKPKRAAGQLVGMGTQSARPALTSWPGSRATTAQTLVSMTDRGLASRGSLGMRGTPRKLEKLR